MQATDLGFSNQNTTVALAVLLQHSASHYSQQLKTFHLAKENKQPIHTYFDLHIVDTYSMETFLFFLIHHPKV